MSANKREYDVVLFGATGFMGTLIAEYIAANLPTDLKWAIAGRCPEKLENVAKRCLSLNSDRIQPVVEICHLDDIGLANLCKRTTIFITTVGPYALYGEAGFKACAETGTHYFDISTDVAFVAKMIKKYDSVAKETGAKLFPQAGFASALPDIITHTLTSIIQRKLNKHDTNKNPTEIFKCSGVILCLHEKKGWLAADLAAREVFSASDIEKAYAPYSLSPIPGPHKRSSTSFLSRVFGVKYVHDLGLLTSTSQSIMDTPIVHRTWGGIGGSAVYGPNFYFEEYRRANNVSSGILQHLGFAAGRNIRRDNINNSIEYTGVGFPDPVQEHGAKAYCRAFYDGDRNSLGEAVHTFVKGDSSFAKSRPGGVLTPGMLQGQFRNRLSKAGFKLEMKMLSHYDGNGVLQAEVPI